MAEATDGVARRVGGAIVGSPVATSIVLAFLLGAAMIAVTGTSPATAYVAMFEGAFTGTGLRSTVTRMIPLVGMALAISLPFRAGIINLGGEGQMVLGGLIGTLVAIHLDGPMALVVPVSLLAGAAAGAAWAALSAFGQTLFAVPILITSLLLNWPARAITSYLVRFPFADPTTTAASTVQVPPSGRIPKVPLLGGVSVTLFAVLALVGLIVLLNRRTVPGYETLMTGANAAFARYGGVDVPRQTVAVMVGSGAIAGAIGTYLITGETLRFMDGDLVGTQYAWTALLVALLARLKPVPILAAGAFFAALQVGGASMQRTVEVPWQLAQVIQAVVIIALASRFAISWRRRDPTVIEPDEPAHQPPAPDTTEVGKV